jgi:hypothetical protein
VKGGYPAITKSRCLPDSQCLSLNGFPEEFDYTDLRPLPEKWLGDDSFIRKCEEEFDLPEKFSETNGNSTKIIYVSLSSMDYIDVKLMKK